MKHWCAPVDTNGNLKMPTVEVLIEDRTTPPVNVFFQQQQGAPTTLAANANPTDRTLTLTSAVGFVAGNRIGVLTGTGGFLFATQVGAPVGNVITIDTPVDMLYLSGSTVLRTATNMNLIGTPAAPQVFEIRSGGTITIDITRIIGYIQSGSAMDDSLFGSLAALTNGLVFRKFQNATSDYQNYWNVHSNGEIANICFDFNYTDKAPAGSNGARFRITYAGQEKHGVVLRLAPSDRLEMLVQDDLSGLEVLSIIAQGHINE